MYARNRDSGFKLNSFAVEEDNLCARDTCFGLLMGGGGVSPVLLLFYALIYVS